MLDYYGNTALCAKEHRAVKCSDYTGVLSCNTDPNVNTNHNTNPIP